MTQDDTATLVAETIAEAEATVREKARTAKEGEELYRAEMPGGAGEMVRRKQSTMVRSGGTPLPERVKFYRSRGGAEAWLPTVQLGYHLAKVHTNPDGTTTPVFVRERPGEPPVPIDETCDVCVERQGVRKKFLSEFDYISHMENKHPREWRIQQQIEEKKAGNFLQVLMAMSQEERRAVQALLGGSDGNSGRTPSAGAPARASRGKQAKQGKARVPCPDCGKAVKPRGVTIHQQRYCTSSRAN